MFQSLLIDLENIHLTKVVDVFLTVDLQSIELVAAYQDSDHLAI